MARGSKHAELEIGVSFEVARIAPKCLAEAYERLAPIRRRPTRQIDCRGVPAGPTAAEDQPGWRRAERG